MPLRVATREERLAHNQDIFRAANEAIAKNPSERDDVRTFICECGESACMAALRLTYGEYERIRSHPRRFALVPGHETAVDAVVAERDGYTLVEKVGDAATVVESRDDD